MSLDLFLWYEKGCILKMKYYMILLNVMILLNSNISFLINLVNQY